MGNCDNVKTLKANNEKKVIISNNNKLNINTNDVDLDLKNKLKEKSDFLYFCNLNYPNLENLNLTQNNLSDISGLKKLNAPKLKILDLSNNNITNLEVFKELNFQLEELYLEKNQNEIENLEIFLKAPCFENLKRLRLDHIDYESNKEIILKIKEKIKDFECGILNNDDIIKNQLLNKVETLSLNENL